MSSCPSRWFRMLRRCPICKKKRRMIHRTVHSGYGSDLLCGGCGSRNSDLDGFYRVGKVDSRRNRETVRREWPTAGTPAEFHAHLKALLEN